MPTLRGLPRLLAVLGPGAVAAVLLLAHGLGSSPTGPLHLAEVERLELSPGFEVVRAGVRRQNHRAGRLVAVFADLQHAQASLLLNAAQAKLHELAPGAKVVANAGYFTEAFKPTGLLVSEGKTLSGFVAEAGAAGSGVLLVQDRQVSLLAKEAVGARDFAAAELAIQAGPRIIEVGAKPGIHSDDGARANRTVIGADQRGRLALVLIHNADGGRAAGPTLHEMMGLLRQEGLGAVAPELALDFALNLDGGPSTGLSLRDEDHPTELPEAHRVLSVLALQARP